MPSPVYQYVINLVKTYKLGALWTDLISVLFKHLVTQMGSASKFACKVVELLREINQRKE